MDIEDTNVLDQIVEANDNEDNWTTMTVDQLLLHVDMLIASGSTKH